MSLKSSWKEKAGKIGSGFRRALGLAGNGEWSKEFENLLFNRQF